VLPSTLARPEEHSLDDVGFLEGWFDLEKGRHRAGRLVTSTPPPIAVKGFC
jgi:hypothetical protein